MASVIYDSTTYEYTRAIKGPDYLHLLDDNGCMLASFDSVSDFSLFKWGTGSTWEDATPDNECSVAVMGDDGVVRKGGHKCHELYSSHMTELTSADDLNNLTTIGTYIYRTASIPKNCPFTNAGIVEVIGTVGNSTSEKVQRVSRYGATESATRGLVSGSWTAWERFSTVYKDSTYTGCSYQMVDGVQEWINPPMVDGVEYRLTKRHKGKPVYTMAMEIGAMPSNTSATIGISVSGATISELVAIDVFAEASNMYKLPFVDGDGKLCAMFRTSGARSIYIKTFSSLSGYTGKIVAEYTKA